MNISKTDFDNLDILTEALEDELLSYCNYNSVGMLNFTADCLISLKERISAGRKIMHQRSGEYFNNNSFKDFVEKNFPTFVVTNVYTYKNGKSFFKMKNTDEGLDLVYNKQVESSLVESICSISDEYELVRLVFNNVVYIRQTKLGSLTPMVSEHGSYYVYEEGDGKIKEIIGG